MRYSQIHQKTSLKLSFFLLAFLLLPFTVAQASILNGELPNFTKLIKQQIPAVVSIRVTEKSPFTDTERGEMPQRNSLLSDELPDFFRHFFEDRGVGGGETPSPFPFDPRKFEAHSQGSGSILTSDGYILTNHHVVANAQEILVQLYDRREFTAKVIGSDPRTDIAVIKIDADNLPTIKSGNGSKLEVGEWVVAIGAPFGFEMSATAGIVSAKARSIFSGNNKYNYVPFIQTDVAINPGNSGGPLLNLEGEMVGVNSIILSKSGGYMGLSFAIPAEVAMDVARQIRETGHVVRGWLGVMIQPVTNDLAESFSIDRPHGALVTQILEDGPAAKSKLQVGDVIVEFNGQKIATNVHLPPIVGRTPVGISVPVQVIRNGKKKTIEITVGQLPTEEELQANVDSATSNGDSKKATFHFGMNLQDIPTPLRKNRNLPAGGAFVVQVEPNSPAARAGIRDGDVVSEFHHKEVENAEHLLQMLDDAPKGRGIPVYILREGGPIFLGLRLPQKNSTTMR